MIQKKHLHILSFIMIGFILGWTFNSWLPLYHQPPSNHFDKLGLDPETIQKVKKLHEEAGEEHRKLKAILNEYEEKFNSDTVSTKNEKELRHSFSQFLKQRNLLEERRFETMLNVHRLLTIEQIIKLRSFGPPGPKPKRR